MDTVVKNPLSWTNSPGLSNSVTSNDGWTNGLALLRSREGQLHYTPPNFGFVPMLTQTPGTPTPRQNNEHLYDVDLQEWLDMNFPLGQ
jgi:hypothetical protein